MTIAAEISVVGTLWRFSSRIIRTSRSVYFVAMREILLLRAPGGAGSHMTALLLMPPLAGPTGERDKST
jgi:hypothetical protein